MTTTFPDAPDFNPESEPWRRKAEETITALEKQLEILSKNYQSFTRSSAAGTKAISLRISNLKGTSIQPGTPINVQVYPYAYFTLSGYPAAGARIFWGDQNDADKYEIWVRRAIAPGEIDYGDFQEVGSSQIATGDIRGLEVLTAYELMIRAVAPGGSYGFFTGVIFFTTPNEETWIPWLGDPILNWHDNFGSIQWDFQDTSEPATVEYDNAVATDAVTGTLAGWGNHGSGVLAPNGKIYYPPGGWGSLTDYEHSRGVILDPTTGIATESDYGLPAELAGYIEAIIQDGSTPGMIAGGALGDDGIIYWVSNWNSVLGTSGGTFDDGTVIALDPSDDTATAIPIASSNGEMWTSVAKGGDGRIYALPVDYTKDFLIISAGGTVSFDDLGYTASSTEKYGQAVVAHNGDIWFMPLANTDSFLVIRASASIPYAEKVAVDYPGGWDVAPFEGFLAGPVYNPADLSIYAFAWDSASYRKIWFQIDPDGVQTYGESTGSGTSYVTMGNNALGADGRIWGMGTPRSPHFAGYVDPDEYLTNVIGYFNPETKEWGRQSISGTYEIDSATVDAEGNVFLRTTRLNGGPAVSAPKFLRIESSRTDIPATGASEIPNYLKHMLIEKAGEDGWEKIGTLAEPGYYMDPFAQLGDQYRFVPISTAGTAGVPSNIMDLLIGD